MVEAGHLGHSALALEAPGELTTVCPLHEAMTKGKRLMNGHLSEPRTKGVSRCKPRRGTRRTRKIIWRCSLGAERDLPWIEWAEAKTKVPRDTGYGLSSLFPIFFYCDKKIHHIKFAILTLF